MKGVSFEQFSAALMAMSLEEIRRQLEQGYGITFPAKLTNKEELIDAAWKRLTKAPTADAPAAGSAEGASPASSAGRRFQVRCRGGKTRWRCGVQWTPTRKDVSEGEFSAEQWAQLRADERLEILDVTPKAAPKPAKAPAKKG